MAKLLLKKLRVMRNRINCGSLYFLPFTARHQKQVVALPSLNSPERSEGDGRCWANLQNTHFSGLTRKNPAFERSVLKYVSIKNRILTPSGQKSRVCVNQPDRLLPPKQRTHSLCIFQLPHAIKHTNHSYSNRTSPGLSCFLPFTARHQKQVVGLPSLYSPERSEGDGRCWANL